ncbi:MAG: DUF4397 domain-containing protein [Candidatus Zixiibacteriota bacterium]|nr:MAG: DUF4397 domain-containing protein [candidate division Zixibacteria bacterium]
MKVTKAISYMTMLAMLAFAAGCSDNDDDNNPLIPSPSTSKVRVVHTSYDAPAVDVWVDGAVAISNLAYGQSSGYAELTAGMRNIQVTPTGQSSPVVIDADLNIADTEEYTVTAVDMLSNISAVVSVDDRDPNTGQAKVRFLHASPDAPAVDIKLNSGNGPAVFSNVSFKEITDYAEVNGASYTFVVTPAGSDVEVFVFEPIAVSEGTVYTVVAHGSLDQTDNYPFGVRVFVDNDPGNVFVDMSSATTNVLVTHASPDAPGVDLLVDGIVVNSQALEFPDNTGYLAVNTGTRNFKVNASGTSMTVIDATLTIGANLNYSIFAIDELSDIRALVLQDDLTSPASGKSHVRFLHLSPDAPAVDITLTDGTVLFGNVAFEGYTDFTPFDSGTYDLQVRVAGTGIVALELPGINLEDGTIYTVFAKGFLNGEGSHALGAEIIVNN